MNPLETYLIAMRDIRSLGAAVPETSYYPPLANLLNEVGKRLKPKVRCVINIANRGAGIPDGGLFLPDQFQRSAAEPLPGQLPARGAMEVKSTSVAAADVSETDQVARYCKKYGVVLVTNYRDFVLVGQDGSGKPTPLEAYRLADSEADFWSVAAHPRKLADRHGQRFVEYLARVMQHNAPLADPKDVAWFLASYARDALARITDSDLPALAAVREALENALGMKFTGDRGEHFFRSTLVQTLFYGVFSAWVLWHREKPTRRDAFDWRVAPWTLRVPFIRALYDEVATPTKLGPLGLVEVLDWTAAVLNRVDRREFFQQFQDEHAVQYFYEPFLEAFDPELRKELGVWYTPPEIVQYQVARVDTVLREELGLPDGLADPNVVVLDPCCGTGAYLVEVLRHIAGTLKDKGGDALVASDLKKAAMTRVFGFEILPAPFVVSHLQLGLMLQRAGVPLNAKKSERVGVYLTNALTGWEPPKEPKKLLFPELEAERDAAEKVKRDAKILVVIGNPPYNGFAGVAVDEEAKLIEPYKAGLKEWGINKNYLDDLYVRFFRLAERRIAEMSGKGVVSFISNFSYMTEPSFVVVRQRFLGEFDRLWFDCMNGDSRETGKVTPDGKPDPSVFSTEYNREGIRVGTAVCVIVQRDNRDAKPVVRFRHFWGAEKRGELLASLQSSDFNGQYKPVHPATENQFSYRPDSVAEGYYDWPTIPELAEADPSLGLNDNRKQGVHAIDREVIADRMRTYFDPKVSLAQLADIHPGLATDAARFDAAGTRQELLRLGGFEESKLVKFFFRPFDVRWAYVETRAKLWNEVRRRLVEDYSEDSRFLLVRCHAPKSIDGASLYFGRFLGDQHVMHKDAYFIPLRLRQSVDGGHLFAGPDHCRANLSARAREYLVSIGIADLDANEESAAMIWMHALAIGYSPAYLAENADGIRRDWPRIPLPKDRRQFEKSVQLGRQLAALLDPEAPVPGVTAGRIEPLFKTLGAVSKVGGGSLDPEAGDLKLTGWGYLGQDGVTMPGQGRVVTRDYEKTERAAVAEAAKARSLSEKQALDLLGPDTRDIYLNETAYWKNVPANVWDYCIGGFQVLKKWLSYRDAAILARGLTADEARYLADVARRLACTLLVQPTLDTNYTAAKDACAAPAVNPRAGG